MSDRAHAILRETEGNPFFVEETLRHLAETGSYYRREGRWVTDAKSISELGIPEGVRDVIGRRLSRLSETTNRVLAAAAVLSLALFRFNFGDCHCGFTRRIIFVLDLQRKKVSARAVESA